MLHQLTFLHEVVEVSRDINDLRDVMVRILLISSVVDAVNERDVVLVSDREFLEQTILLEETEPEVNENIISQDWAVFEDIKVPLFEIIHDLEDVSPLSCIHVNDLSEALLVFLNLVLVWFDIFSVKFLEEVIEILFEPISRIIRLLRSNVQPGLGFHILLAFTCLVHGQLVQLAISD